MPKVETIFLIDDDADDREVFAGALSSVNPTITLMTAVDGVDALQKLKENFPQLPDVIFLDLNMPGQTGKEGLRQIRSNSDYNDIPVIIYSTSNSHTEIEDCYREGANLYVVKPFHFNELISTLQKILITEWKPNLILPIIK